MLPAAVQAVLDGRLDGVSRRDLAERAARLSLSYRAGGATAIRDDRDALAYAVVRMPATFAAIDAAMARLDQRWAGFAPTSILDLGAGPGTATLAARERWPGIATAVLVELNPHARHLGGVMLAVAPGLAARWLATAVGDVGPWGSAELVLAAYLLVELDAPSARRLVLAAFESCSGALVLVEPGTPAGFERIRAAREALTGAGARVVAPCPGEMSCPMTGGDWCHFSVRLARTRDHRLVKSADAPFEDERFSYLIATRRESIPPASARILAEPHAGRGGIDLKLCTPSGLASSRVPRADKAAFKAARRLEWGDEVCGRGAAARPYGADKPRTDRN